MKTFFISDLHLEEQRPEISKLFLKFLHQPEVRHARALYILGDFFESWIGDDHCTAYHQTLISVLRQITLQGLPVFIMRGNRDFLIGRRFLRATGCQLLPDEHVIDLYGVPTLLMHGDTLCTADKTYLQFRKKARNWFYQQLFLMKSLDKRITIAEKIRNSSKKYVSTAPQHIMDVTQSEVEKIMQKHHVNQLIHGHTHRQGRHTFEIAGQLHNRTVLGAWHSSGNALVFESAEKSYFIEL